MSKKGNPRTLLVRLQTGRDFMKNSLEVLEKLKLEILYDPANPILGIYLKTNKQTKTNFKRFIHIRVM